VTFFNSNRKVVLIVEYDGSRYYGFQWQPNVPTVQAELEEALKKLTGERRRVIAASRTDAGVHARFQVVSFRTESTLMPQVMVRAMNHYLPGDIALKSAVDVGESFDVRRDAASREYEYTILNCSVRSAIDRGRKYLVVNKLNIEMMNKVCELIKGQHDFASFCAAFFNGKSTVRTINEAKLECHGDDVVFKINANSFLPHQVRNTVGLLIRVGLSRIGIDECMRIMEAKKRGLAGPTAPAHALCLTKINYPTMLELTK
jgi:tRNA pseudouridine38-40 synthase